MKQKISILLLLCVAILLPSIATAQEFNIFAKQKVVIADIIDVNDRQLSDGIKTVIRKGIMDACVNSEDYEVPEVNLNDVKQQVKAKGLPVTPLNICKAIGAKADYIIFTNVKLSSSEVGAQNITIYISSSLYRIATGSEMKTGVAEAAPTSSSILSTTSNLVSELLGLNSSTRGSASAQSSNTQSHSYSQTAQLAEKTYKVGDYYDANGKQGVVFVVTPDGKHGKMISLNQAPPYTWPNAKAWCSYLGSGWRLPTKEELLLIYKNKAALNSTLAAIGDEIPGECHWSSSEYNSDLAWIVRMHDGLTTQAGYKYDGYYVRAVSAF